MKERLLDKLSIMIDSLKEKKESKDLTIEEYHELSGAEKMATIIKQLIENNLI